MRVWGSALVGAQVLLRSSVGKKLIAPTLITPVHHYCSCLPCRRVISSQKKRLFRGKVPTTVAVSHTNQQRKGTPPKVIVVLAQILVETILRSKFYATASHASSQTSCTRLFWQVVDGRVGKGRFWIFSWSEDQSLLLTHCSTDQSITWMVISSKSSRAHDHSNLDPAVFQKPRHSGRSRKLKLCPMSEPPIPPTPQLSRPQVQIIRARV